MVELLDAVALIAVVAAVAFLVRRGRKPRCAACGPAQAGAETRIPIAQLRKSARRAADRG